ncbi:helix-turn-helix domain-containing protein [Flavobacterium geliluteum]|uniref:Helix-turn-helix transcriptional regulator n=1 Tax=Flavobacterium geliluteum TaxID=2816120 RepID=A0A941B4M3_9FLAO|nr:helix-turn-helix transcriptional regulator [Flavobacterium geliluteum]MBP4139708.1 helix-turn-helix transcriptional regulator [Flavobacterium geliluteum]
MSIGTKIRKLRYQNNKMSQEELAYKVGIAQTSISNIEADKNIPDFLLMEKICNLFGVNLNYFLENNENYTFSQNDNNNTMIGKIENLGNTVPEGILENIIRRITNLEKTLSKPSE